jgi:hypothetical protein
VAGAAIERATVDTETLLLGGIFVSVFLLLAALMVTLGDQYSRFGAVMRCALSSGILVLALFYDLPGRLQQDFGIGPVGTGALWVTAAVGAVLLAVVAITQFVVWLRIGEGDPLLPSPKREARRDAEDGAEREQA